MGAANLMEIASKYENRTETGGGVFMTEAKFDDYNGATNSVQDGRGSVPMRAPENVISQQKDINAMRGKTSPRAGDFSQMMAMEHTTAQNSYFESKSISLSKRQGQRMQTKSPAVTTRGSTYGALPTKNIKFEKFIELMFTSGMDPNSIQSETVKYVQALETNYTETIRYLK